MAYGLITISPAWVDQAAPTYCYSSAWGGGSGGVGVLPSEDFLEHCLSGTSSRSLVPSHSSKTQSEAAFNKIRENKKVHFTQKHGSVSARF